MVIRWAPPRACCSVEMAQMRDIRRNVAESIRCLVVVLWCEQTLVWYGKALYSFFMTTICCARQPGSSGPFVFRIARFLVVSVRKALLPFRVSVRRMRGAIHFAVKKAAPLLPC